jgi:hypothetical protein
MYGKRDKMTFVGLRNRRYYQRNCGSDRIWLPIFSKERQNFAIRIGANIEKRFFCLNNQYNQKIFLASLGVVMAESFPLRNFKGERAGGCLKCEPSPHSSEGLIDR